MTALGYDGPIPPEGCSRSRFAHRGTEDIGILYILRDGDAVFDVFGSSTPQWIENWRQSNVEIMRPL